jgi:hypothetical protein
VPVILVRETDISEEPTDDGGSRASETSVYFYETTLAYITESCHLHTQIRENLKSHLCVVSLRSVVLR